MKPVTIIAKTHLDIGFTDLASVVTERYLHGFIRQAIETAEDCRRRNRPYRYVWTVGSWLVRQCLDRLTGQELADFEAALRRGDIVWHALPFTTQTESAGLPLFEVGLGISKELDSIYGRKTIAAKLTDVPGHTRGLIAPLARAGVRMLHIGVNLASRVPDVPEIFRWRDSHGNEIVVVCQSGYGGEIRVGDKRFSVCLTNDNLGPHTPEQVEALVAQYGGTEVVFGTLDEMALALWNNREAYPTVTSEIGDSWIYGVGSDPWKMARFQTLRRWYEALPDPAPALPFARKLLEIVEHTWGLDEKMNLFAPFLWDPEEIAAHPPAVRRIERSWAEKRHLLREALRLLPQDLRRSAHAALRSCALPKAVHIRPESCRATAPVENESFRLIPSPRRGCAARLTSKRTGVTLPLPGLWRCESFTRAHYERFRRRYVQLPDEPWAIHDFLKPDLPVAPALRETGFASDVVRPGPGRILFVSRAPSMYGALETEYVLGEAAVEIVLRWRGKRPWRVAQAAWLSFSAPSFDSWRFLKLGEEVDPLDVVSGGGRHLHGVQAVRATDPDGRQLEIHPLDAALVAPGRPALVDYPNTLPDLRKGVHFNLHNNTWGTNFPMWVSDDMAFRFRLVF